MPCRLVAQEQETGAAPSFLADPNEHSQHISTLIGAGDDEQGSQHTRGALLTEGDPRKEGAGDDATHVGTAPTRG